MKRSVVFVLFFIGFAALGNAQLTATLQYSTLSFFGVNYEINERFKPELRLSTNAYFSDLSPEVIATYDILDKKDYELYAGIGGRFNALSGFIIPIGMTMFPFEQRNFGFAFEIAPIFGEETVLRGSIGFSYRFDLKHKSK